VVVNCSTDKDFEIQSWNEQGEITKIEGMLTIAFSFIFPCSHMGCRKELYLIMKIPYMVNMSMDKESLKNILREVGEKGLEYKEIIEKKDNEIEELKKRTDKLELENNELKENIKELTKKVDEISLLKKENLRLKIISGEAKSGWKKDRNMIERDNPITRELEFFKCPIHFSHNKVENLEYLDKKRLMIKFFHRGIGVDWDFFEMATDAYLWLCGELPEQKKETKKSVKIKIDSKEQMLEHLDSCGIDHHGLDYLDEAIDFILRFKGKKFETKDFRRETGIQSPTTIQNYLKMFEKGKVLLKIKTGLWEVTI